MIKLILITAMLIGIGGCSSTMEKVERMDLTDAAMGCGISYAEAKELDEDEARLCRKRRLNADMKERTRCDVISGGSCVNP
tara:strand:- start:178 stop:420 length:243 start_codon:yes stop_codon:yes gene_type:complete